MRLKFSSNKWRALTTSLTYIALAFLLAWHVKVTGLGLFKALAIVIVFRLIASSVNNLISSLKIEDSMVTIKKLRTHLFVNKFPNGKRGGVEVKVGWFTVEMVIHRGVITRLHSSDWFYLTVVSVFGSESKISLNLSRSEMLKLETLITQWNKRKEETQAVHD